jgi:lysophospholipase L1-like esterase
MKTLILAAFAALSMITTISYGQQLTNISMADPSVRLMGRAKMENGSATLGFPGQEIELKFSGSASVKMSGTVLTNQAWFSVYIDGEKLPVLEIQTGKYHVTLSDKLDPAKSHLLRLVRRNEAWQGIVRIDCFELDNGAKVLPPDALPARKILAIGDSITCGQSTELGPVDRKPGNQWVNAELSYAWFVAKDFNAQVHLVSYGGKGVMRDWRGLNTAMAREICADAGVKASPEVVCAGDFFERSLPDDGSAVWDHSKYLPDLVLICLGQNDYSQISIPVSDYATAYIKLVDRVHEVYPKAQIILMSSPIAEMSRSDGFMPRGVAIELALTEVNQHYIRKGELFVIPFFVSHQPGSALDAHPTGPQQRATADELKPVVKAIMGW